MKCFLLLCCSATKYAASANPSCSRLSCALVISRLDYGSATPAGLPACRYRDRLRTVLNFAARLIYRSRKFDHVITPLSAERPWLRIPKRITFRLSVLAYRCQKGLAPQYLTNDLHQVAEVESRRRLRSAATVKLIVPATARSTIGDRSFSVAAARAWNSLFALCYVLHAAYLPDFR